MTKVLESLQSLGLYKDQNRDIIQILLSRDYAQSPNDELGSKQVHT